MSNRPLVFWLSLVCVMIFFMALIGAVTRLTESGLSITRWEPLTGAVPPLTQSDWNKTFDLYKHTPQYRAIHSGMSLPEFKTIYFWEWLHRLWGRLIGLVYAAGLIFFWARGKIPNEHKGLLLAALVLGGLQGFVGWFMVQSGLQAGMAAVSPYRLAMHLGLALILYGLLFIEILRLWPLPPWPAPTRRPDLRTHAWAGFALLCAAMLWGVFTAGLDAGKIYNSFPLMDGQMIPTDIAALRPFWRNLFENPAAAQLMHRALTITTAILLLALAGRFYFTASGKPNRQMALALGFFSLLQPALGIATLLTGANIALAVLHQAGAILLLSTMLIVLYALQKTRA
ncbi:MAG: COX15/CtaA family protein [Proteobacteria bacterium]|nr:COX15/CtaA family protein [Pseudomonadota bacterium]